MQFIQAAQICSQIQFVQSCSPAQQREQSDQSPEPVWLECTRAVCLRLLGREYSIQICWHLSLLHSFPFDEQTCTFFYGTWAYPEFQLNITVGEPAMKVRTQFEHQARDKVDVDKRVWLFHVIFVTCCVFSGHVMRPLMFSEVA